MNRNSLLEVSKKILMDNKDFKAHLQRQNLIFQEKQSKIEMIKILEKLYNEKIILDHGVTVAKNWHMF